MQNIIILIFLPSCNAFCEAYWRSNISSEYSSSPNLSEPENAISALTYSIFGLIGMLLNNYSNMYYLLMSLFIILGISSFLHHYYYANAHWALIADLMCTYFLTSFSFLYIICDNEYFKCRAINKILIFLIITNHIIIQICNRTEYSNKIFVDSVIYGIFLSQLFVVAYFFYIKSRIKYRIVMSVLWNFGIGTMGYALWIYDIECTEWSRKNKFNGHMIWHINIAWALFNTINITNVSRYTFNKIKFRWIPAIKCAPWFLFIIVLSKEKSNITDSYTDIELGDAKFLLEKKNTNHRRVNTYG